MKEIKKVFDLRNLTNESEVVGISTLNTIWEGRVIDESDIIEALISKANPLCTLISSCL